MATTSQNLENNARASPGGDARRPRPSVVSSGQGLPAHGRGRPKKRVQQQQQPLRLGTLNIGTMTGRSRELADTLKIRRIDIACIQETKWTGAKARDIGDGFKLFYNGNKPQNGVGIVVSQKVRDNVVEVTRMSDRLMSLKIDTGDITMRVTSCYAPQTNCSESDKEDFWESLDVHLRALGPEEYNAIGGDLNGHVG
ncbi:craniofacial development protein 2-like [Erpetoichthys calabaricus]|uniref:craniofacial development protein 2-like n=1 Tax=Erpetoichthys calabaricus TaxID=27687 RepID=UPI002234206A|nr:craniofacial development protein 2-like [Erpetoichthys calabaricus]